MKPEQQSRKKKAAARGARAGNQALRVANRALRTANQALRLAEENRKALAASRQAADWKTTEAHRRPAGIARAAAEIVRAERTDRERREQWEREWANKVQTVKTAFAASLPRVMAAHGIVIAAEDVRPGMLRSPDGLEYDFVAANGEVALAGVAELRLTMEEVLRMMGLLNYFRRDYPEYAGLKLHGVVAGGEVDAGALDMARREGFFVLRLDGDEIHSALDKEFNPTAY